jgi:trk system potassium uptake protein
VKPSPTRNVAERALEALHRERRAFLAGLLLTLGFVGQALPEPTRWWSLAWLGTTAVSVAGLLLPRAPRLAHVLTLLGLLGQAALAWPSFPHSPGLTLLALSLFLGTSLLLFPHRRPLPAGLRLLACPETARGATVGALLVTALLGLARPPSALLYCALVLAVAAGAVLAALLATSRDLKRRAVVLVLLLATAAGSYALARAPVAAILLGVLGLSVCSLLVRASVAEEVPLLGFIFEHPARLVVFSFLLLCLLGTIGLALPPSAERAPLALVDAAFTAVSAVCVTGLSVVDTPRTFSMLGEVVLLACIQLGGLGIMALYTTVLGLLGSRLSLRHEQAVSLAQSLRHSGELYRALRILLIVTVLAEALGAVCLYPSFARVEPSSAAWWRAIFCSVSAFCNAGFALSSDNLVGYATSPAVLHVIGALVVLGGLSPAVITSLPLWFGRRHRMTLTARVTLASTAVLLVAGWVLFLAFEWSATLGPLTTWDKLHNAWFQSVTTRTAGFNSVDTAELTAPTRLLFMVLMFIGGSPGSTAGGVKTTTATLLVLAVVATLRGQDTVSIFGARLPPSAVARATAVFTLFVGSILTGSFALLLTQPQPFDALLFEVVSATATVGLSLGVTPELDTTGKLVLMLCMFAGRVGPLTLLLLLAGSASKSHNQLPERELSIG